MLNVEEVRRWRAEALEHLKIAPTLGESEVPAARIIELADEVQRLRHNETAFDAIIARLTPDEMARIYQAVHEEREARGLE